MWKNYFKSALRNFWRYRAYSSLNLLGLVIGMTASLLIFQFVVHELSFDRFHRDVEQIYRVRYDFYKGGERAFACASTFPGVGPAAQAAWPEVMDMTRMYLFYGGGVVRHEDRAFKENGLYLVDSTFATFFDFPWVAGDRDHALDRPNSVIIAAHLVEKYFGDADPLGKRIQIGSDQWYEITGVMAVPEHSHVHFSFLGSLSTAYAWGDEMREVLASNWGWYDFHTYLKLRPGTNPDTLTARFPALVAQHASAPQAERTVLQLQALKDIHLYSDLIQEHRPNGNGTTTYALLGIALFILVIAWINYVNLATARAMSRAREVGIRKTVGAQRRQLMGQFLAETFLLNAVGLLLSLVAFELARGAFEQLLGYAVSLHLFAQPYFWPAMAALLGIGTLLAGMYPAFLLSAFRPVDVLKGRQQARGIGLRRGLVVFQFAASIALIAGTLIVYQQIRYMRAQDLGIDLEQVLVVEGPGVIVSDSTFQRDQQAFKQLLLSQPGVRQLTATTEIPGNLIYWTNGFRRAGAPPEATGILYKVGVDADFVPTYNLSLLAGRNYDPSFGTEDQGIILNETALRQLGFADPAEGVGTRIFTGGDTLTIIGALADYHQQGLKQSHQPIGLLYQPASREYFSVKLEAAQAATFLETLPEVYARFFPENPVNYFFLDAFYDQQYRAEQRFGRVFLLFAALAILVACLGLVGLSMFSAQLRRKEFSVRKVLGASVEGLFMLLAREFLLLVLLSNLIALPLAWWAMQAWLETFAYRIQPGWGIFALAMLVSLLVALGTVSWQAWYTAWVNPAEALRED